MVNCEPYDISHINPGLSHRRTQRSMRQSRIASCTNSGPLRTSQIESDKLCVEIGATAHDSSPPKFPDSSGEISA